jgi:hypothetical protein
MHAHMHGLFCVCPLHEIQRTTRLNYRCNVKGVNVVTDSTGTGHHQTITTVKTLQQTLISLHLNPISYRVITVHIHHSSLRKMKLLMLD